MRKDLALTSMIHVIGHLDATPLADGGEVDVQAWIVYS
jgi:hypothetical protein